MSKLFQISITCGVLSLISGNAARAEDSQARSNDGRRLAMALPKTPRTVPAHTAVVRPVLIKNLSPAPEPSREFASQPNPFLKNRAVNKSDNVREVLIDGAEKIEQFSRSHNRRVADVIFWMANSMGKPTTYTPAAGPHLQHSRRFDLKAPTRNERQPNFMFQID